MNAKHMLVVYGVLFLALFLPGCGGAIEESGEETAEEGEEVPAGVDEDLPLIRIAVPDVINNESLMLAVENAEATLDTRIELVTRPTPPMFVCLVDPGDLIGDDLPIDLILSTSQSVRHLAQTFDLMPVPSQMIDSGTLSPIAVDAFTLPGSETVGLAQATAPVMLIYKTDVVEEFGYALTETVSWQEMIELVPTLGIVVPGDSAFVLAAVENAYEFKTGESFTSDILFESETDLLIQLANEFAPILNDFANTDGVIVVQSPLLANGFSGGMVDAFVEEDGVALALADSSFLSALAARGYDGPLGVSFFPSFGGSAPGTSTHMAGWLVPSESTNAELAWRVAEFFTHSPEMMAAGLGMGLLPVTDEGFTMLVEEPGFNEQIRLPNNMAVLQDIASESIAWQTPVQISPDTYNTFLRVGDELLSANEVPVTEAAMMLLEMRPLLDGN
jgi:ABC-type glycerol-3-phosphate transport system substrate-binding protein